MIRENCRIFWRGLVNSGVALGLFAVSACSGGESAGSQRSRNPQSIDDERILVLTRPPLAAVTSAADIDRIRLLLDRLDVNELAERTGSKIVTASELAWISGSMVGREFLAEEAPARVLVRGAPRAQCPVAFTRGGLAPVSTLAASALRDCLAEVGPGCGCEVVAAGSVLLVERDEVEYATGIAARLHAPALGLDRLLVAEETRDGDVLLRDLGGVVGTLDRREDGQVEVMLRGDSYAGRSIPVGFRRGRLAERIYATNADGQRLSLLIGFDPEELSEVAGAWLAWPDA